MHVNAASNLLRSFFFGNIIVFQIKVGIFIASSAHNVLSCTRDLNLILQR